MPLIVDGVRGPVIWAGERVARSARTAPRWDASAVSLHIALVNNMPDSALADTENQFFELLDRASDNLQIHLKLFSLPGVRRGDAAQKRLSRPYFDIDELWNSRFDAVIVTGTEPCQADLRREPYWSKLVEVLEWAETHTASAVLSCLAAHAGVLHTDGIERRRLSDKQFGVFDFPRINHHILTERAGAFLRFPHSRWNEVDIGALTSCGYELLTCSSDAGADLFVKRKKTCLFLHFQGHPEYDAVTLLNEYRRDIRRFLKRERATYPNMPQGYFDATSVDVLNGFRNQALADPSEVLMAQFPHAQVAGVLQNTWQWSATYVYRNWLQYVAARQPETSTLTSRAGRAPSAFGHY